MSNGDERERIDRARGGERAAQEQLLLTHYARLAARAKRHIPAELKSLIDAEDILQQTFVRAIRDIANFEYRGRNSFYGWLKTIADHCLADTVKHQRRKKRGGTWRRVGVGNRSQEGSFGNLLEVIAGDDPTASRIVSRQESVAALQSAIACLPNHLRRVVELYHLQGKALSEIATELGSSRGAIRGMLYRARQKLRDDMGEMSLYLSGD